MPDGTSEKYEHCVRLIHKTVIDPDSWNDALAKIAHLTNAESAEVLYLDPRSQKSLATRLHQVTPRSVDYCFPENSKIDAWVSAYLEKKDQLDLSRSIPGDFLIPGSEISQTNFYMQFPSHYALRWLLTGTLSLSENLFAFLNLYRSSDNQNFTHEDRERYDQLLPHLQQAFKTTQHLNSLTSRLQALKDASDTQPAGVIVLDTQRKVIEMSRPARAIIATDDGLTVRGRQLIAWETNSQRGLASAITAAVRIAVANGDTPSSTQTILRRSGKRPYIARMAPVPSGCSLDSNIVGGERAAVLVFISDPEASPEPSAELLRYLYGLTPAEARFALCFSAGHSVEAAAEACGITRQTARTRLKHVFLKTGTHSQMELVRLLLAGPGAIARPTCE